MSKRVARRLRVGHVDRRNVAFTLGRSVLDAGRETYDSEASSFSEREKRKDTERERKGETAGLSLFSLSLFFSFLLSPSRNHQTVSTTATSFYIPTSNSQGF